MKLVISIAIKHSVYLQDVAVRVCAGEFVTCAIKAQHKLFGHMALRTRHCPVVYGIVIGSRHEQLRRNSGRVRLLRIFERHIDNVYLGFEGKPTVFKCGECDAWSK